MPQVTKAIDVHTQDLEQVAGARESRGAWLRPASPATGWEDWVVCDSSGSYVEGSQLAFCELTSSNYEELRWRHGFDGDFGVFRFFEARDGWGTAWNPGAPNGTMTISNILAPMYCWDIEHDISGERLSDDEASAIELRWCEEKDETGYYSSSEPPTDLTDGILDGSKWLDKNFTNVHRTGGYSGAYGQTTLLLNVDDSSGTPDLIDFFTGSNPNKRDPIAWDVYLQVQGFAACRPRAA